MESYKSYVEIDGARMPAPPAVVQSMVTDLRIVTDKVRATGESRVYPLQETNADGKRAVHGFLITPTTKLSFLIVEEDCKGADELREMFQRWWKLADFDRIDKRLDELEKEIEKKDEDETE